MYAGQSNLILVPVRMRGSHAPASLDRLYGANRRLHLSGCTKQAELPCCHAVCEKRTGPGTAKYLGKRPSAPFSGCYAEAVRAPTELLSGGTLERLERLTIRWSQSFQGRIGGDIVSRFAGVGHEFLDHRHYQQGDDLRAVNWRAFMRLERMFLKLFRSEPRIPVRILIDTSESMAAGAAPAEAKFTYACRMAAALCFVGLVRLETVVLQPFSERLEDSFHADGGRLRYARAARYISSLETGGGTSFRRAIRAFLIKYRVPGITFLVSDFLDPSSEELPLEHLANEGHEVHLLHVASPDDREPPWRGDLDLLDAETGAAMRVSLDDEAAREYRDSYDQFCRSLEEHATRSRAEYLHVSTADPVEAVLFRDIAATRMDMGRG